MTELVSKKDTLIKIRNEQVEHLVRSMIDSKLFFEQMVGVDPKKHEEAARNRANCEETIKVKKRIIAIIDKVLLEEKNETK